MSEKKVIPLSLPRLIHGQRFYMNSDVIRFNTFRCVYASGLKQRVIEDRNGNFYARVTEMNDQYFQVHIPIFGQAHEFRVYFSMCNVII